MTGTEELEPPEGGVHGVLARLQEKTSLLPDYGFRSAGEGEESHLKDWGVSAKLTPAEGLELGGSFLSDLVATDARLAPDYRRRVPG